MSEQLNIIEAVKECRRSGIPFTDGEKTFTLKNGIVCEFDKDAFIFAWKECHFHVSALMKTYTMIEE